MTHQAIIEASQLSKCYTLFDQPSDRLKQMLWSGACRLVRPFFSLKQPQLHREFWALRDFGIQIQRGEVIGVVGKNGAGKSTLLQLICGTLEPTSGQIAVRGRVAALLELGAGFNPEFTGRENVVMAAAILGLPADETQRRMQEIIDFAGIGSFIDQPVKTYSSGMYVRLAFSVATSIDPDILVIDEALSVGDGEFSRRSFDRIMALKDKGATILFCSHAMYHVQALCSRAIWMENGRIRMVGDAASVTAAYETALVVDSVPNSQVAASATDPLKETSIQTPINALESAPSPPHTHLAEPGTARFTGIEVLSDGHSGKNLPVQSGKSTLTVRLSFASDPQLPCPSVALGILHANGSVVTSAGSANDHATLDRDALGAGSVDIVFEQMGLLQGDYSINVFLLCERGLHIYDHAERVATLRVVQQGLEQGLVTLPRTWHPRIHRTD